MSIFKAFLLFTFSASIVFPYSENCGSPLITGLTLNSARSTIDFNRSQEIGSSKTFSVRNLSTNELEEIEFKLLSTDGVSNFYGEIAEISNGHIDLTVVEELFYTFTSSTIDADSLNLQGGIRTAEESILGPPPTINGGTIVNILLLDIRDGYSNSGEFVAGFFDPQDQYMCLHENGSSWLPSATIATCSYPYNWQSNSNGENIIYIDSNPSIINENGLGDALFTLAHEYQHLLHWNADMKEGYFGSSDGGWTFQNPWINEGISDLMPSILGLGLRDFTHFLENPTIGLDEWAEIGSELTLPYYAKSALFFQYLYESEGLEAVGEIFNSSEQGLVSIESKYNNKEFETILINWIHSLLTGQLPITNIDIVQAQDSIENYAALDGNELTINISSMPKYAIYSLLVPQYIDILDISAPIITDVLVNADTQIYQFEEALSYDLINFDSIILFTNNAVLTNENIIISYQFNSVEDCMGIWGGSAVNDECGICNGNNLTCAGCTDIFACNYNAEAIVNDGCVYPNENIDCSSFNNDLIFYPNPLYENNSIYFKFFTNRKFDDFEIIFYNLNGRLVYHNNFIINSYTDNINEINLNLSSGIYFVYAKSNSIPIKSKTITIIK